MADSFIRFRISTNILTESEDDTSGVIEASSADVSFVNNKNVGGEIRTVIPDSDEGSDTEVDDEDNKDENNDSIIAPIRKKSAKHRVISDSEPENGSDYEDQIVSKSTRRSIYGFEPLGNDSDNDSDLIESDKEQQDGDDGESSDESLSKMAPNPYVGYTQRSESPEYDVDDSQYNSVYGSAVNNSNVSNTKPVDLTHNTSDVSNSKPVDLTHDASIQSDTSVKMVANNDSSVIALSSDDEGGLDTERSSPVLDKKPTPILATIQPKISTYVKDYSYPNSGVKYVTKQVKENALNKLNGLKMDLQKVKYLLESMNINSLPDKGEKLKMRAEELKVQIRELAENVSNLVVEPEMPSAKDIKNDGYLSWNDIKTGSKAVQPTKFGAQALNTHMAQRQMTLHSLQALHKSLDSRPTEDVMAEIPRGLKTQLMPHQLHALAWLKWRETQKPRGGILADDMGLGKTLTMISLIVDSKENNKQDDVSDDESDKENSKKTTAMASGGTLVVCPASLLKQWHNEITNHCKKHILKAHIHHGLKREVSNYKLAQNDIVITTYNLVQRELDKRGTLTRIKWQRIILDEAHIVRNHKSQTARAVFQLTARYRWCLTGTPLHNKDLDLFALLKFLQCEPFDDIALWKKWIDNKSTGGQERLFMIMKTLLLRRTKQQLQQVNELKCLPQKNITLIDVELSKEEMNVYQKVLVFSKSLFAQFLQQREDRNNSITSFRPQPNNEEYYRMHKKMAALSGSDHQVKSHEILVLLLRLRQICCHSGLIHSMLNDEEYEGKMDQSLGGTTRPDVDLLGELAKLNLENEPNSQDVYDEDPPMSQEEGQTVTEAMSKVLNSSNPVFNLDNQSAKVSAALKCLEEKVLVHKGDKAIIVSQWTSMLDIVEKHLKNMNVVCSTLSGKVPVTVRHDIVNSFNNPNSNIQVLLLSLCAGGVGLNLVGGNHMLLLDLHWNPQLEAQAQDRIYRVGQTKTVHIYKFMCTSTVEQTIKMLQDKKLAMAENILTGSISLQSSKLSIEDLKLMFNMVPTNNPF